MEPIKGHRDGGKDSFRICSQNCPKKLCIHSQNLCVLSSMLILPWALFFLPPHIISIISFMQAHAKFLWGMQNICQWIQTLMGNTRFYKRTQKFLGRILNICKLTQTITGIQKFCKQTHFSRNKKSLWEKTLLFISDKFLKGRAAQKNQ